MFETIGSRTFRYRFLIVAAWIVAALLSYRFAPSLVSEGAADQSAFLPPYAPSAQANAALQRAFPGATSTSSATLTFSRDVPLTEADMAYLAETAAWATSNDAPRILRDAVTSTESASSRPELKSMLESSDGKLQLLVINLDIGSASDEADAVVTALRDHVRATAPAGLEVHVTGSAGISTDYLRAIKEGTSSTTAVTIALVVVILLLIYRAPLAALVPLLTIGAAYVVSRGALGTLAAAGWKVSSLLDTFLVVLVFGVGTDYTIFLISRFREEVRGKADWHDASRSTVRRIGAVITASAATVIVGLAAMAFGDFEMIRSTGPALGVAIAVTLVAGLTLAPALLGIFGHYLFWPLHDQPKLEGEPTGLFSRLAAAVSRHPGVVVAALLVALLVPAGFLPRMRTNFDVLAELPADSDARAGFDLVADHLGRGTLAQATGLIDTAAADVLAPAELARLRDTMLTLQATPGVATVTSLVTPNGDGVVPDGLKPSAQLVTIGDAFEASGSAGAGTSGSSSSLLDPKLSSGLAGALDYVGALGAAFPDVAGRSEYRAATKAIGDAQDLVAAVRKESVVATQLRALASALTSPTSAGSGGGGDSSLIAAYLDELAAAYPEVRSLPAFQDATVAGERLSEAPSAGAAIDAADALNAVAVHFDAMPDATLVPTSLANTPSALEAKRQAEATFAAIPIALDDLATIFRGRSDDLFIPLGLGGDDAQKLDDAVAAFVSKDRTATRFYLTATDDPYSTQAFATTRSVQNVVGAAAPGFGAGTAAYIGGATAQLADVQDVLASDFTRVGIVTVLGILLVLVLLLRALVAPLYLVATVLVSYGSAVGLSAWLFQGPLGHPGVSFYLPLMVFVLLVALGSDYNIFLMSRVREESETRPIRDGIRVASGHTGAVITSAGLILAGTFGSMATAQLIVLFQVGVAVAIGVLIDTFVVRSILVPAITTLLGDRAWWPSGTRLATLFRAPGGGGVAPEETGAAGTSAGPVAGLALVGRERRSPARVAVALALAVLVPATFAGLITWAQQAGTGAIVHGAIVNADEGATITAADGSTQRLDFGATLADGLVTGGPSDTIAWETIGATDADGGLASGRYAAVLTIPSGFSRAIAAIRADAMGSQPAALLHLETGASAGATTTEVAREVRAVIAASATSDATASYVADVLLAVSTTHADVESVATGARDIADRTESLASDASGIHAVAGEMVSGLDALASGAAAAVTGTQELAAATKRLADGTKTLASGTASLATGAGSAADGAKKLADGTSALADGLGTLETQTKGLPAQVATLASGAADLSAGAASAASGASQLSSGLATLKTQTTGFGAQVQALDSGAASLATGAASLATGANQAAGAASSLATGADALDTSIQQYTGSIHTLSSNCLSMSGGTDVTGVCAALAAIDSSSSSIAAGASGTSAGASQLESALAGVTSGAATVSAGAVSVHDGTSALAASAPALESGIAQSATGAATLADGAASVASGASGIAAGSKQLSDGIPDLVDGIEQAAAGAAAADAGAASLSTGVTKLATGASQLDSGMRETADGARMLASGTASSASSAGRLTDAVQQAADGARLVQTETDQLATDGSALATDASGVAGSLESTAASGVSYPLDTRKRIADRVAQPVTVEATTGGPSADIAAAAIAPLAMAIALWLGALGAFLVLPSGRRSARWWGPLAAFAGSALLGLAASGLMVAVLKLGLGLEVARLGELVAICVLASVAFTAVVDALVVLFGTRGWLVALLLAALQAAAAGYPVSADALPAPLAIVHPLLPVSWTVDALRSSIQGSGDIIAAVVVLLGWLAVALFVTLAATVGATRAPTPIATRA